MVGSQQEELRTLTLDHHGIVAAVCKDLKIAQRIDEKLGVDLQRVVSPGQAVVAMIINGLGFTNRRLYLAHQFFATKPIDRLLDADISAEDLTDYTLGHTLDEIHSYGASKLFGEVAFATALDNNLLSLNNHLDTTSLSVHGEYEMEDDAKVIEITNGYSKDHRQDLKQVVLSLVVNGPSNMPLWMEPLDGNSNDKKSFHETIKNIREFQKQIKLDREFKWIADSALYTKDGLLSNNDYKWVTRVPEYIKEAKDLVFKNDKDIAWHESTNGYKMARFDANYGGVEQRWLLIFSAQAYEREKKTLDKKLDKQDAELKNALWHLGNQKFNCAVDALKKLRDIEKEYKYHTISGEVVKILKHAKRGKPKVGDEKIVDGYTIEANFCRDTQAIEILLSSKGRFILATNDLDVIGYPDEQILTEYKEQQGVEGGFRFLKDPWFMVDSVFLKLPSRIEALMMVMTLCLMVYNVAQYKLREKLKATKDTLPNQLDKQVQNPTMRWIFQIMEGVCIVQFYKQRIVKPVREIVSNLNSLREKIIRLFGDTACYMYGLMAAT